jgi:hypothetical protein
VYNAEPMVLRGKIVKDLRCGVLRAIIHGDYFVVGIIELEQSFERAGQFFGFIARGENNRDARATRVFKRGRPIHAREAGHTNTCANALNKPQNGGKSQKSRQQNIQFDFSCGNRTNTLF